MPTLPRSWNARFAGYGSARLHRGVQAGRGRFIPGAGRSLLRAVDLVAEAAHGGQVPGMGRILLDLGAHALDVHVEGLRVADVIGAPDAVDELVSGHHAPLVLHEVFEQFEFLEREEHAFAAHGDLMLADLHGDVAAHQRDVVVDRTAGLDRALVAPQDRADAREQLAERVGAKKI